MNIRTLARRHPLASYFGLVFLVAWGGSLLLGVPSFLRGEALPLSAVLLMAAPMLLAPFLVGIFMTWLVDGREGLEDLLARQTRWRGGRWYAALLIFPALILTVTLILSGLVSPAFAPTFFVFGIVTGLIGSFLEETGWMGFAYPRMQRTWGILAAALYLGLMHGAWHVVADFLGNRVAFGSYWLPYFAGFFLLVVALRFLIVWVYANTESLWLAQLMHASSTGFLLVFVAPFDRAPRDSMVFYLVYAVALALVAAVVVRYGAKLTVASSSLRRSV